MLGGDVVFNWIFVSVLFVDSEDNDLVVEGWFMEEGCCFGFSDCCILVGDLLFNFGSICFEV